LSRDPIGEAGFEFMCSADGDVKRQQARLGFHLVVCNAPLREMDKLGSDPEALPGTVFTVGIDRGGRVTVTLSRQFSKADEQVGSHGFCLVRELRGSPRYLPCFPDVYWATFSGTAVEGLTYKGHIFIASVWRNLNPCCFARVAMFGGLLAHEADHYYTNFKDQEPGGPDDYN